MAYYACPVPFLLANLAVAQLVVGKKGRESGTESHCVVSDAACLALALLQRQGLTTHPHPS